MAIFLVIGGIDRAIGNRFGLGEQFEEGLNTFGPLGLAMVGMISLAPILSKILSPVVVPVYEYLGADPAMFAGTLLANDMAEYHPSMALARRAEAGRLAGGISQATPGCVMCC